MRIRVLGFRRLPDLDTASLTGLFVGFHLETHCIRAGSWNDMAKLTLTCALPAHVHEKEDSWCSKLQRRKPRSSSSRYEAGFRVTPHHANVIKPQATICLTSPPLYKKNKRKNKKRQQSLYYHYQDEYICFFGEQILI